MSDSKKQPLLFFGHGSPMNAIENNSFTQGWKQLSSNLNPKAIVVISAHWETRGTKVFSGINNKIIYDFYGFPKELYDVKYVAKSSPDLADKISKISLIEKDDSWGLDHGAWSVLVHAFPNIDIPVIQISLNKNFNIADHWKMAQELKSFREKGILFVGSGNIVHNLRKIVWTASNFKYDWAEDIQEKILKIVKNHDYKKLVELAKDPSFSNAHPTIEHYLPLIYTFGLADEKESSLITTPEIDMASLSMASFLIK